MKKKLLTALAIGLFLAGGISTAQATPIQNDLQVYYQFNGNGNDSSGNSRNLTLFGNVGFAPGLYGQALDLHANINQYAQRPVSDSILDFGSNDFTTQLWVNFNSMTGTEQTMLEKASNAGSPGWTISKVTRGGQNEMELYGGGIGPIDSSPLSITTGTWHQLITRRDGNTFDLFYDDLLVASTSLSDSITSSPNPLLIGRRTHEDPNSHYPVDGRLDEIAIWTRSLSNDEISTLYNNGMGTPLSSAPAPAPVPEPATMLLFGTGIVGLVGSRIKRKKK